MPSVSFSIVRPGVKAAAEIKPGDSVVLRVVKSLSGGKWQVSHNGKLFVVGATIKLEPGQIIRTRAERSGNRIILRQNQSNTAETANRMGQLPGGPAAEGPPIDLLLRAFQKIGLQIDTLLFRKAREAFLKSANRSRTTAAVLAALAEKNLSPDIGIADYISSILDRDGGSSADGERKRRNRRGSKEANVEPIIDQLKLQFETPGNEDSPLQLFNHLKGKSETWILLPYSINRNGVGLSGTIRLRVDRSGKIRRVAFDASAGPSPYTVSFDWPFADGDPISVGCADNGMLKNFLRRQSELPEKLRNLDSINDDNSSEGSYYDSIALERTNTVEGVDRFA